MKSTIGIKMTLLTAAVAVKGQPHILERFYRADKERDRNVMNN